MHEDRIQRVPRDSPHEPESRNLVLLYFGPEVLMPLLSAVAAAVGAILIVGKRILHWIRSAGRWIGGLFRSSESPEAAEAGAPEGERSASSAPREGETSGGGR